MDNSAKAKAKRTSIQAFIGSVAAFFIGLVTVVWAVPGVPEAVTGYLVEQAIPLAIGIGIPSGAIAGAVAYWQNRGK